MDNFEGWVGRQLVQLEEAIQEEAQDGGARTRVHQGVHRSFQVHGRDVLVLLRGRGTSGSRDTAADPKPRRQVEKVINESGPVQSGSGPNHAP